MTDDYIKFWDDSIVTGTDENLMATQNEYQKENKEVDVQFGENRYGLSKPIRRKIIGDIKCD